MLNNLPGVTSVHGRFYDLSSKYYRIIGNHASYYKDALRYLGCVDIKDLPGEKKHDGKQTGLDFMIKMAEWQINVDSTETEKQERAFTLGLAGLLGEGVYNFGELVRSSLNAFLQTYMYHFTFELKLSIVITLCLCSSCILCWSLWGTQTNSGSLIHYTPSMQAMLRNSRALSLPGANRWFTFILANTYWNIYIWTDLSKSPLLSDRLTLVNLL